MFNYENGTSSNYLNSLFLQQKVYQVWLRFLFCFFRFLVSNKFAELVHIIFVYFVGFVVRFDFVTKVL